MLLQKGCMERIGYESKEGNHSCPTQTVLICNERSRKVSVSMCRIQTPWRNPACSAFLTAPTDVITGPCDPWWSDSSQVSTPLPLARKQAADSGHWAPPRTALLPVQTTCRIICLNCKHQQNKTRSGAEGCLLLASGALLSSWRMGWGVFWWQVRRLLALIFLLKMGIYWRWRCWTRLWNLITNHHWNGNQELKRRWEFRLCRQQNF